MSAVRVACVGTGCVGWVSECSDGWFSVSGVEFVLCVGVRVCGMGERSVSEAMGMSEPTVGWSGERVQGGVRLRAMTWDTFIKSCKWICLVFLQQQSRV